MVGRRGFRGAGVVVGCFVCCALSIVERTGFLGILGVYGGFCVLNFFIDVRVNW